MTAGATRRCVLQHQNGQEYFFQSCSSDEYQCRADHRMKSQHKGAWVLSRPDECHTFCLAHPDPAGSDRWYFSRTGPLGADGERLARFMSPGAAGSPWHGFPVGGKRRRAREAFPSEDLVQEWRDANFIDRALQAKINRRVI